MMKLSFIKILLTAIVISLTLNIIWFWNISENQFLFIHDEVMFLTKQEILSSFFFIRNSSNFGSAMGIDVVVGFFDRLFYIVAYLFNGNTHIIQMLLYFLKVILLIVVPYLGFKRLTKLFNVKSEDFIILIISLWYSFNTFTLIYWNTQSFSLTALICYSLAPLTLYFYHRSIFEKNNINAKITVAVLLFLMSFAFYLFAVFVFLLFIYTLLFLFIYRGKFSLFLKNLLKLVFIYLPFFAIDIVIPYDMFTNKILAVNFTGNEAYGNLSGGFLYQLLMWYSWPIYVKWEPRNIFTFAWYFQTIPSLLAPFILYGLVIVGLTRNKLNKYSIIFLSLFLLFLLFIKGAQEPLGDIYLFLIKHFYFFNVFRSPDTKFGFGLVFVITILLILVAARYRKKTITLLLLLVIIIQSFPLFSGIAIRGENTAVSSDRIISITQGYKEAIDFLNKNSNPYGYILPFPPDSFFSLYKFDSHETHLGQDLLPKLSINPFSYLSNSVGISTLAYNKLLEALDVNNLATLKDFPIRYFIVRRDVVLKKPDDRYISKLSSISQPVFKNNLFTIYEYKSGVPIIQSGNMQFKINNPVSYALTFRNIKKDQKLFFNQSFNANWKLYPASNTTPSFLDQIGFFWQKPFFDTTHELHNGYANDWIISPAFIKQNINSKKYKINPDGSIDFSLVLYYKPQSVFYNGAFISFSYFLILMGILLYLNLIREKRKTFNK